MKLQLLGTGSIAAKSFSACTLINNYLLIDMPNGILKNMSRFGLDVTSIKYVFITHLHGDHFVDIPFYMLYKFMNKCDFETIIYGPEGICERVKILYETIFPGDYDKIIDKINIKFIEYSGSDEFSLEIDSGDNLGLKPILVNHGDLKPAYGCLVSDKETTVGFSGDSIFVDSIKEILNNSKTVVFDASMPYEGNASHMGINDLENLCTEYPEKKIICTHMGEGSRERAEHLFIRNLIVPKDGDVYEIN